MLNLLKKTARRVVMGRRLEELSTLAAQRSETIGLLTQALGDERAAAFATRQELTAARMLLRERDEDLLDAQEQLTETAARLSGSLAGRADRAKLHSEVVLERDALKVKMEEEVQRYGELHEQLEEEQRVMARLGADLADAVQRADKAEAALVDALRKVAELEEAEPRRKARDLAAAGRAMKRFASVSGATPAEDRKTGKEEERSAAPPKPQINEGLQRHRRQQRERITLEVREALEKLPAYPETWTRSEFRAAGGWSNGQTSKRQDRALEMGLVERLDRRRWRTCRVLTDTPEPPQDPEPPPAPPVQTEGLGAAESRALEALVGLPLPARSTDVAARAGLTALVCGRALATLKTLGRVTEPETGRWSVPVQRVPSPMDLAEPLPDPPPSRPAPRGRKGYQHKDPELRKLREDMEVWCQRREEIFDISHVQKAFPAADTAALKSTLGLLRRQGVIEDLANGVYRSWSD